MAEPVEFEWDAANRRHLAEHDVQPEEAEQVLLNNPIDLERHNRNGEERIVHVGATDAGRILVAVSTFLGMKIRVITAWPAKERLRRYWLSLRSGSGKED
jgi:uncharacterized DUF497 family protein